MVVKRGTMPKKLSKSSIKKGIKKVKGKAGKKINKKKPTTAQVSVKKQSKIIGDLLAPELPESFETPTTTKSILRKKLESSASSAVQQISSNAEAKEEENVPELISEPLPKAEKKLHKVKLGTGKSQNKTGATIKNPPKKSWHK
uniref:Uncharacterized protein n=1 Tax=Ditylenchus dipsaci TaxID=166011 RepID=A0A915E3K8_9BILA